MTKQPYWHPCVECGAEWTHGTLCKRCACTRNGKKKPRKPCSLHDRTRRDTLLLEKQGKIQRRGACERCGKRSERLGFGDIEIHHIDYSDPYAVQFLCRPCHRIANAELREQHRRFVAEITRARRNNITPSIDLLLPVVAGSAESIPASAWVQMYLFVPKHDSK